MCSQRIHLFRVVTVSCFIFCGRGILETFAASYQCGQIPGTNLKSGIWYSIDMPAYSPGFLTYSRDKKSNNFAYYLFHAFQLKDSKSSVYEKGGKYYNSTLWVFLPSVKYPGWYKLGNMRFPGFFVTWSKTRLNNRHPEKNVSNYMMLEKWRHEEDFLLKPVMIDNKVKDLKGLQEYFYQLKTWQYQSGVITWIYGGDHHHYIQNDHRDSNPKQMAKYKVGGEWFEDTLFTFEEEESAWEVCRVGRYNAAISTKVVGRVETKYVAAYIALIYFNLVY